MRTFLRDLAGNTSVMVGAVVVLMSAAAWVGHDGGAVRAPADVLSWSPAAPAQGQGTPVVIGGRRYVLTILPETGR